MTPAQWAQMTPTQQAEHAAHYGPPPAHYYYAAALPVPMPPQRKKSRKGLWIGVIAIFFVIVAVGSTGKSTPGTTTTPAAAAAGAAGHTVTYKVTGSGEGSVTYMKEGFSQEQSNDASLPWSKDLTFKDDITAFSGLSLVAQHSSGGGNITCQILVDGKEVASSTSSGAYAVVTCNGVHS